MFNHTRDSQCQQVAITACEVQVSAADSQTVPTVANEFLSYRLGLSWKDQTCSLVICNRDEESVLNQGHQQLDILKSVGSLSKHLCYVNAQLIFCFICWEIIAIVPYVYMTCNNNYHNYCIIFINGPGNRMLQAPNISPWHTNIDKLWILIIWSIQSCTSDEYFMGLIIDVCGINFVQSLVSVYLRHHFVYVPSQWEMALQCNAISHWLGKYTEWSLFPLGTLRLLCNMVVSSKYSLKTLHIPPRARYALYFVSLKCDFLPVPPFTNMV